jgi:uncharacterized membrane protein
MCDVSSHSTVSVLPHPGISISTPGELLVTCVCLSYTSLKKFEQTIDLHVNTCTILISYVLYYMYFMYYHNYYSILNHIHV